MPGPRTGRLTVEDGPPLAAGALLEAPAGSDGPRAVQD